MDRSLIFFLIMVPASFAFLLGLIAYAAQAKANELPDEKAEAVQ
jgi:hypothetical protein